MPADVFGLARFVDPDLREGHPDIRPRAGIVLDRDVEAAFVQVDVCATPAIATAAANAMAMRARRISIHLTASGGREVDKYS